MYKKLAQKVFDQLGPGYTEFVYKRAFELELRRAGIDYEVEKVIPVVYTIDDKAYTLSHEKIDIYDKTNNTIIELKSLVPCDISKFNLQLMKYICQLKNMGIECEHAYVINFPQPKNGEQYKIEIYNHPM